MLSVFKLSEENRSLFIQILVAFAASSAFIVNGGVRSWSSPCVPTLLETEKIEKEDAPFVGGLPPTGALLGALAAGPLLQFFGRRRTLMLVALPWSASFILLGLAPAKGAIFVARIMMGFMVGVSTPAAQLYIAECSEPRIRGILGSLTATLMAAGILITYIIGSFVECNVLAWIISSFTSITLVGMFFSPESPAWLLAKNREQEARQSLRRLRGLRDEDNPRIDTEISRIKENINKNQTGGDQNCRDYIKCLVQLQNLKPFGLSLALMFFQQFCGINTVIFHTGSIFIASGSSIDRNLSTVIVGIVQLVFTSIAMIIVDKTGRRILLLCSSIVMLVSLVPMGTFFFLKHSGYEHIERIQWIPLLSLVGFMIGHSIGYNTLPFLIMSEIFPSRFRNVFSAVSSSFNLFCLFVVVFFYSSMVESIGEYGVFWMYALSCLISIPFVYFLLPETKGKTLEEIEGIFEGRKNSKQGENIAQAHVNSGYVSDPLP